MLISLKGTGNRFTVNCFSTRLSHAPLTGQKQAEEKDEPFLESKLRARERSRGRWAVGGEGTEKGGSIGDNGERREEEEFGRKDNLFIFCLATLVLCGTCLDKFGLLSCLVLSFPRVLIPRTLDA